MREGQTWEKEERGEMEGRGKDGGKGEMGEMEGRGWTLGSH